VIRAVTRAHTAVIDHLIQALAVVKRRLDWTDRLTRRFFAVHTGPRLEVDIRIVQVPLIVAVDLQPMHLAPRLHAFLAHHGDVVFHHAGEDTRIAADTGRRINRHTPGITFVL